MRTTLTLVVTASVLLSEPDTQHWGYRITQATGIPSGVLYPVLARMLTANWLTAHPETPERSHPDRRSRARRYYTLTDTGRTELGELLAAAKVAPRFRHVTWPVYPST